MNPTARPASEQETLDALSELTVPKQHAMETIERVERAARAKQARAAATPGPYARVHTEGYRHMGRRRKRELALFRGLYEPDLRLQRAATRGSRRVKRAARS